jgi:predicted metalloendopeptidase
MDTSVAPGDDFFAYANGAWIKTTEIPADRAGYGNSAILSDLTTQRVNELLKAAAAQPGRAGTEAQQISDYYSSYMDEAAIEAKGAKPLTAALTRIDEIFSRSELAAALGETVRADVDVLNSTNLYTPHLFGLWVAQDLNDPKRYSPFLLQGGLGLPDREYYLSNSQAMAAIRPKYQAHIASVLALAGIDHPADRAAKIFELERRMAEVWRDRMTSSSGSRARSSAWSGSPPQNRSTPGRIISSSTPSRTPHPICPRPSSRKVSPSTDTSCSAFPN